MEQHYDHINRLLQSSDVTDNLGALRGIDELIDVPPGENASNISKISNYLRDMFETKRDPEILILASIVLGHLARSGGAMAADEVERQVNDALDWLRGERVYHRRFGAVLILKEMAENASTVFNVHISEFVEVIWTALCDPNLEVRERAVDALRACLRVIEKRETRWRVQWYFQMFEATQDGLVRNSPVHSIHGSLLAVGELLRNTGDFMMPRYREVADIVVKYVGHRDRLVRLSITSLLPRIAHFLPDRFVTSHLQICMNHIITVLRIPAERSSGFVALGEMAGALGAELTEYLPTIMSHISEAITSRKGRSSLDALACAGNLAKAMGSTMEAYVNGLLDVMFSAGLSVTLVAALEKISMSIESQIPVIQNRLHACILKALSLPHSSQSRAPAFLRRAHSMNNPIQAVDVSDPATVQLALQTLGRFNFQGHELLEFGKETVVVYLDDVDAATRKDAALCCCRLISNFFSSLSGAQFSSLKLNRALGKRRRLVEEIVEKLLTSAVSDEDVAVRYSILSSLEADKGFDDFLSQADSLVAVFAALNDEDFKVRECAISVAGRLSEKNPAYVLPALRGHLILLLTYLGQSSDNKCKEKSAKLLGCLIRNCERLILPYIAPVHKVLVAKLCESSGINANNGFLCGILVTVGDLARVGGFAMRQYIPELMPLIVDALLDGAVVSKRELAVTTLGQVVQSTGYVISPYKEFPQLLGVLLKLLNGDLAWSTRREVLKVIGIMGAVDPHAHKLNPRSLSGSHGEIGLAVGGTGQHLDELSVDFWPSVVSSEDYFSTVAISSLMLILKDPSSSSYHPKVVGSLMFIFKSMGLGCVPYLSKVLPELFLIVRTCEGSLKEFITLKLGTLVSVVRQHIRKYMPELLPLISELWRSSFTLPSTSRPIPVLHLVEELCLALNDEFRTYTSDIFPLCIQVLSEAERSNDYSYVVAILHTLEVFGGTLDEHMHLLLPILTRLLKTDVPANIRLTIIKTLTKLIPRVQVVGHVSSLVHQFKLVLDGNDNNLRKEAVDALCCLAHGLGHDFNIFIPSIHRLLLRHGVHHKEFEEIKGRLQRKEPLIFGSKATKISDRQLPGRINSNLQNDIDSGPHDLVSQGQFRNSQNKEFVGIEGQSERREPHIYGRQVSQRVGRQLPVEISSDSPNEIDNYPHEFVSDGQFKNYQINEERLLAAGDASQRSTAEDWTEWMRHFSLELLRVSPSPALSSCASLAQLQPSLGRELFSVSYASCWAKIPHSCQDKLVRSFEIAFSSPTIPPEILASLLNLAEFMEHDEKPLPIDIRLLTALSEKCGALAKSLHYKELEFQRDHSQSGVPDPVAIESLIHINNQLQQHEAALGILTYAQQSLGVQLKESWYEKLQRWEDVLKIYTAKASQETNPTLILDATLGRMRCLAALARWEELNNLCKEYWAPSEQSTRLEMASMAASAAWNMGEWDLMESHVSRLEEGVETMPRGLGNTSSSGDSSTNATFFKAVLCVRRGKYDDARDYIERTRKCLATELAALVLESYERSYSNMVRVQQLSELEEVIDYCTLPVGNTVAESRRALIRNMWTDRIHGAKHNVEVWQSLLAVRTLVLPPTEDIDIWLKFASLCRKHGRINHARSTLIKLLQYDPERSQNVRYRGPPQVMLGYLKFQWSLGEDNRRKETFLKLMDLAGELSSSSNMILGQGTTTNTMNPNNPLLARVYHCLGTWQWALSPTLNDDSIQEICNSFWNATQFAGKWEKAWHSWALFNTAVLSHYSSRGSSSTASPFVVAAVTGYFHSIACSANAKGVDDSLQDILRLLTLWFNHGDTADVQMALQKGFSYVNINTWLAVLPQIIARIHSNNKSVKELIQSLLVTIGYSHPQALMYPLLVACKSVSNLRSAAAQEVVDKVRQHSGILVDQAHLVSKELIRVAILWHEMWHEALEEASRFYFGEHDIEGMLNVLEPLHVMLEEGAMAIDATLKEKAFIQAYRHELLEAYESCMKYKKTGKDAELTQAWDLYYHVFKRIDKQLQSLTTLDLQSASPALVECRDFQLAVPGTYKAESPVVTISSFAPQLEVITSKQRPRKLTIHGSDGEDYTFLLKGHEDLRQDERVMQLFGLANTLLSNSRKTAEKDLSIQRYAVIPLSPNSGLIGWVPNCDTLHYLIREYRDSRKIVLNQEHKCMLSLSPDYDHLPLLGKVEVFEYALQNTPGNDLSQVLWLKSRTSEIWLDRRTNYTRSLAVMSMVGYLLGLGDRHPSNLMLHRYSGKILHIDFGDCFEASMNREKFPEKVPFRLTRMLVKAMEISGIEGNFRSTCENVMQVLRTNKDSVMAMMEAFVHDPLINWRLFNINEVPRIANSASSHTPAPVNLEELVQNRELPQPLRGARERELLQAVNQLGDANDVLNERAVFVMARMSNKLTGRDFSTSGLTQSNVGNQRALPDHNSIFNGDSREVEHGLSVKLQVQKLIVQAMSHENLCQNYVGWCPFW